MFPPKYPIVLAKLQRRLDGGWPTDGALPPVRTLAHELETSPVTLLRCLKELKLQGRLSVVGAGSRYVVKGSVAHVEPPDRRRRHIPRYKEITSNLQNEILAGTYSGQEGLPRMKVLLLHFGCSQATLLRALDELRTRGLIERVGRLYRLRQRDLFHKPGSQVYLTGFPAIIDSFHSRVLELVTGLERGIRERGWGRLRLFLPNSLEGAQLPPPHTVAGYIYISTKPGPWREFFLAQRQVPVVVVDPSERIPRIRIHPRHYRIQADNRFAGAECGRFLAAMGHRHVAFITHHPIEFGWSANRLAGLREVWPHPQIGQERSLQVVDFSVARAPREKHLDEALKLLKNLHSRLGKMEHFQSFPKAGLTEGLREVVDLHVLAYRAEEHLERLWRRKRITAWVCLNDTLAAVAQDFFERKGVPQTTRPAIIGFDNSPLSRKLGLASYDFGFDRMGHYALALLENPDRVHLLPVGILKVRGQVIPRDSIGGL